MASVWLEPAGVARWISRANLRAKLRSELMRRFCAGVGVWCANMLSTFIAASPSQLLLLRVLRTKGYHSLHINPRFGTHWIWASLLRHWARKVQGLCSC